MRDKGKRGVEFPGCAAWWLRSESEWPGRAPEGVGGRSLPRFIGEARHNLDTGALGDSMDLPGRLHDCLSLCVGQENERERLAAEARTAARKTR